MNTSKTTKQKKEAKPQSKKGNKTAKKRSTKLNPINIKRFLIKFMPAVIMGAIAFQIAAMFPNLPIPRLVVGIIGGILMKLLIYFRGKNAKKWRQDEEYGSARWGTAEDIRPFIDENPANNIILTKTEVVVCK